MTKDKAEIEAEAIGWAIRLRDAGAGDWEDFTNWLEADPAHRQAYDEVSLLDDEIGRLPAVPPRPLEGPQPLDLPQPGRARRIGRRALLGWGAVAAAAGVLGYIALPEPETAYAVATGPGQRRTVDLADARIELNGSTRLIVDPERPRRVRLEHGEALFTVEQGSERPFEVEAGGTLVRDLGTVFNIVHEGDRLEVGVAEGRVVVNPASDAVRLSAGMVLRKNGAELAVGREGAGAVAGWRAGRLTYSSASFEDVARDISRNTGLAVRASPEVAERRFSGVIMLDGDDAALLRRVSALLGVEARRDGQGWVLAPNRP